MPDPAYWKRKLGELSNKRQSFQQRARKATGREKKRLQEQARILKMDMDRANELLNESRKKNAGR